MKKIEKNGYIISQANNNHIMICKDGQCVMHITCTQELSKEELEKRLDFYFCMENIVKNNLDKEQE